MTPTRAIAAEPFVTETGVTGPSFAAALCGFLSTTVATTMVMFLLSSL